MSDLDKFRASASMAARAVLRNPLRAGLTVLGITIGVGAVVTVTALGRGARENVGAQIANLGSNALMVFPRSAQASGMRDASTSRLSELDVGPLVNETTSIAAAAPFLRASAQVLYEGANTRTSVIGTRLDYFTVRNWNIDRGELWSVSSESVSEKVVVLGKETATKLFGARDPVGHVVRLGRKPFRVLGVLEEKGQSPFGQNQDEVVLMPITTMRAHVVAGRPNSTSALLLSATSAETTERAKLQAEAILRQRHRIREGEEDDFMVRSQAEFQALQDSVYGALSALLVGIAAVSLLVGGIGVMNIMLVSVTERTREIGVRLAIGARQPDILAQFLLESVALALLGGLSGTLLGLLGIWAFGRALDWPMTLDPWSLALATGVSTLIGLVFGYVPARRAARMNPVEALRIE